MACTAPRYRNLLDLMIALASLQTAFLTIDEALKVGFWRSTVYVPQEMPFSISDFLRLLSFLFPYLAPSLNSFHSGDEPPSERAGERDGAHNRVHAGVHREGARRIGTRGLHAAQESAAKQKGTTRVIRVMIMLPRFETSFNRGKVVFLRMLLVKSPFERT